MPDEPNDVWELAEFCALEAMLLRSFLDYLCGPDSPERKQQQLEQWRKVIGMQLGNPQAAEMTRGLFQKVRAASPAERMRVLQQALGAAYDAYFSENESPE